MAIQEKIKNWIKETLKITDDFVLAHPKDIKNGDYSFFVATGDPKEFAEALRQAQGDLQKQIEKIEVVGKFINFYLTKDFFADAVEEINRNVEDYGKNKLLDGQKIIIEHTQPNPFKEFHIGHLMNNTIGESVARILTANGADITTVGYHGDVGLHVAKALWAKMEFPKLSWSQSYVLGNAAYEQNQLAPYYFGLGGYLKDRNSKIDKQSIIEINRKISEKSNEKINKLYENGKKLSLDVFESLYTRLNSYFDHHFYESETGEIGKKIVLENVPKVFEKSDNAIIFRGENFEPKTHTRVFINSDGIPTYEAKEVGLAKLKKEKYEYDKSITVTANEQDSFFDVTEVAIGEIFPDLKGKLLHLSHGMLKLPSGKMSSRTGDVITAESLIEQVKGKVQEKIKDPTSLKATTGQVREFSEQEKENISEIVAIGAIKYSILKQAIGGDIIFDFDKSISFEGDSGPYLQYTAVRANSVLEKSKSEAPNIKQIQNSNFKIQNWETTDLERYLYRFPEVVERAGKEYAPHYIVTYLTELASIFNSFYARERIIDENDPASPYKIALTSATAHVLKNGLHLLGIKVPDRM